MPFPTSKSCQGNSAEHFEHSTENGSIMAPSFWDASASTSRKVQSTATETPADDRLHSAQAPSVAANTAQENCFAQWTHCTSNSGSSSSLPGAQPETLASAELT